MPPNVIALIGTNPATLESFASPFAFLILERIQGGHLWEVRRVSGHHGEAAADRNGGNLSVGI